MDVQQRIESLLQPRCRKLFLNQIWLHQWDTTNYLAWYCTIDDFQKISGGQPIAAIEGVCCAGYGKGGITYPFGICGASLSMRNVPPPTLPNDVWKKEKRILFMPVGLQYLLSTVQQKGLRIDSHTVLCSNYPCSQHPTYTHIILYRPF